MKTLLPTLSNEGINAAPLLLVQSVIAQLLSNNMRQIRRQSISIAALALLIAIAISTFSPFPSSSSTSSLFTQAAALRKQECSFECQYNAEVNTGELQTVRECCDKHTPSEGGKCSVNEKGNVCQCSVDKACYVDTRCEYGGDWPDKCIYQQPQTFLTTTITATSSTTTLPPPPKANKMRFKSFIGNQFFNNERSNEASGLALAPDKSHLIVVSDNGKIFFLNLLDYTTLDIVYGRTMTCSMIIQTLRELQ